VSSLRVLIAAVLFVCALLAGCGGGDDGEADNPAPPVAKSEDFPKANGKTLAELSQGLGQGGPVLAPSVSQLTTGNNRFGFGLFDRSRAQIADAAVAVYVAPAEGGAAQGPYPARYESLAVRPQFQSRQTATDPDSAQSVYVADIPFDEPGEYEVLGITRINGRLVAATSAVPRVPVLDTAQDTIPRGGDIASIDTRIPPSSMHSRDFADVVGKKPTVLIFATPALCQSRVCGPVVDIAESVKAGPQGEGVEFIHQEVFVDNRIDKGLRPQLAEYNLRTEPWLFAVDGNGKVAARLEGAFSERELIEAIRLAKG
jgi:hypothetical protein